MNEDKEARTLDDYESNLSSELKAKVKNNELDANDLAKQVAKLQTKLWEMVHLIDDGQKIYSNYFFYDGSIDMKSNAFKKMNSKLARRD